MMEVPLHSHVFLIVNLQNRYSRAFLYNDRNILRPRVGVVANRTARNLVGSVWAVLLRGKRGNL